MNEQELKELSRRIEKAKQQEQQEKSLDLSGLSLDEIFLDKLME
ncbi:hypothetical protein [Chryseobacterium candidae]|nr:hypothetical protein [Chryseobacterium candidae]